MIHCSITAGSGSGLVIGAGAAPWVYLGRYTGLNTCTSHLNTCSCRNAEMMPNLRVESGQLAEQQTRISCTHDHVRW